jgi:hypothetical protein
MFGRLNRLSSLVLGVKEKKSGRCSQKALKGFPAQDVLLILLASVTVRVRREHAPSLAIPVCYGHLRIRFPSARSTCSSDLSLVQSPSDGDYPNSKRE